MKNKELYILGLGHNTPVFIDLALDCGYEIIGLYHYNDELTHQDFAGYKVLGTFQDLWVKDLKDSNFMLTMGDLKIRKELSERIISLGGNLPTFIHPSAVISRYSRISETGVIINAFSHIQANTIVESNVVILSGVVICHDNIIGKNSFIADHVTIGALTIIEEEVFWGQGSLSISGKVNRIGTRSYIGARALLTKNVPRNSIIYGSPARVVAVGKNSI